MISSRLQDVVNHVYLSEAHLWFSAFDNAFSLSFFIGGKKCECSCKDALFGAFIGILVFIIILLIIYVVWLHKKGNKLISFLRSYFITGFCVSSLNAQKICDHLLFLLLRCTRNKTVRLCTLVDTI